MMDGQFEPLQGRMPTGVQLQVISADIHVGLVERYIRTTKERTRCTICVLPYKYYPFVMVQEIVAGAVFWLNVFPPKSGVSTTFGPRAIVLGTQIDYKRHWMMECGQYVEPHEPHNNSMNERTCPAIFLQTNGNEQGGAFFMSLRTGQRLNRQGWTVLPMPDSVIATVHALAKTTIVGLPFHNRKRKLIETAHADIDPDSTGVIEQESESESETSDEEEDSDDEDDNDDMPGLQDRDTYDGDSDDEEEDVDDDDDDDDDEQSTGDVDDDDDDDDDEQSTGVRDDESTGVEVETVEEEETEAEVPNVRTKGVPTRNTRTRTSRRVKQSHLNSDFVYTNYS
jgi:hypothetical protein